MFALLTRKRFAPLFWTQFLSAFNDNFLKNALIFTIMFRLSADHAEALITLAGALFMLPFFLLSALGGQWADRHDKALVARRLKLAELAPALLAVAGFALQSVPALYAALTLFGCIAALFGPIKYGILPDHLPRHELAAGNALIEGATFVAILIGTLAGGLVARRGGDPAHFAGAMIFISLACYGASRFIPPTGEAAPELRIDANIFRSTRHLLADLRADRNLWRAGVMVSLFWMFGAIALSLLPPAVKLRLGGDEAAVSLFLALFAVAVALGSGLGAALCRDRIRLWPTPFATALIGLAAADLGWALQETAPARGFADFIADPVVWRVGVDFALMAAAGGVLAVPSFASAQAWAPADKRARVIAAINVLNAAFMVTGALAVALLQASGLGAAGVFGALAPACWLAALWMRGHLPDDPSRD